MTPYLNCKKGSSGNNNTENTVLTVIHVLKACVGESLLSTGPLSTARLRCWQGHGHVRVTHAVSSAN